jgi:putative membrane protein
MPFTFAISPNRTPFKQNPLLWLFLSSFLVLWIITLLGTNDLNNWLLENTLTVLFFLFLIVSYKKYQFSDLSYLLITVYLCLHVYGAKYTYAENPFGYWLKDYMSWERNHYDRIVHFSFGFLLAYPMRELFLKWVKYPNLVAWVLPIEIVLSMSGFYEIIEWLVAAVFFTEQGVAYLGVQGDVWDAQKDITVATLGAILATSLLSSAKRVFISVN